MDGERNDPSLPSTDNYIFSWKVSFLCSLLTSLLRIVHHIYVPKLCLLTAQFSQSRGPLLTLQISVCSHCLVSADALRLCGLSTHDELRRVTAKYIYYLSPLNTMLGWHAVSFGTSWYDRTLISSIILTLDRSASSCLFTQLDVYVALGACVECDATQALSKMAASTSLVSIAHARRPDIATASFLS